MKTNIVGRNQYTKALRKLAANSKKIKSAGPICNCWSGLFVYEASTTENRDILSSLSEIAGEDPSMVINCVSVGPDDFFRYWEKGGNVDSRVEGPVWHSYELNGLSPGYFVGNIINYLSWEKIQGFSFPWFPVEGGKESRRKHYIGFGESEVGDF